MLFFLGVLVVLHEYARAFYSCSAHREQIMYTWFVSLNWEKRGNFFAFRKAKSVRVCVRIIRETRNKTWQEQDINEKEERKKRAQHTKVWIDFMQHEWMCVSLLARMGNMKRVLLRKFHFLFTIFFLFASLFIQTLLCFVVFLLFAGKSNFKQDPSTSCSP